MPADTPPDFTSQLVRFLVDQYYGGELATLAESTGYSKQQIKSWMAGERKPRAATLRYLMSKTLAPEFTVVCEYEPIRVDSSGEIGPELSRVLGGNHNKAGIYAFYDSMCNLFYVGKASTGLKKEIYQQLRNPLGVSFSKSVANPPEKRWQVVSFISAYEIPYVEHLDYPKHVEALILRLSKPIGNKVLGTLNFCKPPADVT